MKTGAEVAGFWNLLWMAVDWLLGKECCGFRAIGIVYRLRSIDYWGETVGAKTVGAKNFSPLQTCCSIRSKFCGRRWFSNPRKSQIT